MLSPPIRSTSRLELCAPVPDDAKEIFARYASDLEVTRYVGWACHRNLDDTRSFIEFSRREWQRASIGPYLIRDRISRRLLGATGLSLTSPGEAMTGYVLAKDAWGCGYATEALHEMVEFAEQRSLESIFAICHVDHAASRRVLIKGGFMKDPDFAEELIFPNLAPESPQLADRFRRRPGSAS